MVQRLAVVGRVHFRGERTDIVAIMRVLDVLLVPSREEPFGRTIIEGMAMGTPVIATSIGGPHEIITGGVDGLLLAPADPLGWARAAESLLSQPDLRARLGDHAQATVAERFSRELHVSRVLDIYRASHSSRPTRRVMPQAGSSRAPMRVLFVNHTSEVSGAEVAMLRLLDALPASFVRAVACPPDGPLAQRLAREGVEHLPIPGTAVSFRLHPLWTLVGLRDVGRSVHALNAHVRSWRPDVIHANGTRAGLLAVRLRSIRAPALVVQVHDILPDGHLARAVARVLAHSADRIVAVSDAATRAFDQLLPAPVASTLRISIDHSRFRPHGRERSDTRRGLSVADDTPLLGEIAQITPWKGQLVAIESLAYLHRTHPRAQLLLIGDVAFAGSSVRYDNAAYARQLRERVSELGLEDAVHFLGYRDDVPTIMAALDLALLPSWEEPFGTVVAEAMACGTVPLVTSEGGPREIVDDGVTGRVLPPRDPLAWARAAGDLLDRPQLLADMGLRAAASVRNLTDVSYAEHAVQVYEGARAPHIARRA